MSLTMLRRSMRYKPAANKPPTTKERRKNITASLLFES
jgi:hypothetical protein